MVIRDEKAAAEAAAKAASSTDPQPGASKASTSADPEVVVVKEEPSDPEEGEEEPEAKRRRITTRSATGSLPPAPPEETPSVPKKETPAQREKKLLKEGVYVGKQPPKIPVAFHTMQLREAQDLGFSDTGEYLRLKQYLKDNGGRQMLKAKGDGACLFHSLLQCIDTPKEYSQVHLRRDIVLLMAQYPEFFLGEMYDNIVGEYCVNYMSEEEYQEKKAANQLEQWQIDQHNTPGPYSYVKYLEALLQPSFWGDGIVLFVASCLLQVPIAVIHAESLRVDRIRNTLSMAEQDITLVIQGKRHYMPCSEYAIIYRVVYGDIV